MSSADWIGIIGISFVLGTQIALRLFRLSPARALDDEERAKLLLFFTRWVFRASVVAIFFIVSFWSYLQFRVFPPALREFWYFSGYVGTRFFAPWAIALAASAIVPLLAHYGNKRMGERFFEREELPLFALGIFLTGYPGFLFYLTLLLFSGILLTTYYSLYSKGRAPFYYLWLPVAIFAILIVNWIIPSEFRALFNL